ncbi:hypothetical protein B0H13DRAFT_2330099 [Mycena leptocephala]|nr:hypothetical protein B0H13DRAFT_2330099 [Mycena leptocephala]
MPQSREDVAAHRARMEAAMLEDSPAPPVAPSRQSRKRKRTDDSGNPLDSEDEDTNDDDELPRTIVPPSDSGSDGIASTSNGNMVAFAKQFATHKRLKPSQISEVEAFAADSVAARQIKIYTVSLLLEDKLASIVTGTPDFAVSSSLDKNMRQLAYGIMISTKIASYKGRVATAHLLNILKKQRFDLPPGIEFIPSDWQRVKSRAEYQLTQCRATLKKFLKASMPEDVPPQKHSNIFKLGQRFVKDTQTVLTVELCARIAVMRAQFLLFPGEDFWDELDIHLTWMREKANFDENKVSKAFKAALKEDREAHGKTEDYKLPEDAIVDAWQHTVDESIAADDAAA